MLDEKHAKSEIDKLEQSLRKPIQPETEEPEWVVVIALSGPYAGMLTQGIQNIRGDGVLFLSGEYSDADAKEIITAGLEALGEYVVLRQSTNPEVHTDMYLRFRTIVPECVDGIEFESAMFRWIGYLQIMGKL